MIILAVATHFVSFCTSIATAMSSRAWRTSITHGLLNGEMLLILEQLVIVFGRPTPEFAVRVLWPVAVVVGIYSLINYPDDSRQVAPCHASFAVKENAET
jgi:hypothetical protein